MRVRSDVLLLRCGELELGVCPRAGGSLTSLRLAGRDLLRPATARFFTSGDPVEASSFPLVPFSNRIENGVLVFRGRRYTLPRNMGSEPHSIHGQGWQQPWRAVEQTPTGIALELEHEVQGTPFRYRARQQLTVAADGIELGLELVNEGREPMPAGLGFHPYFERGSGPTLEAELECVWLPDELKIPRAAASLPVPWDFSSPRPLDGVDLDHCFGGWQRRARLCWPRDGLVLELVADPPLDCLVLYVPPRETYFCVEPVSHVPDAFNLWERGVAGTGTRILEPGQDLRVRLELRIAHR
jgi:aldose 1-epimerase